MNFQTFFETILFFIAIIHQKQMLALRHIYELGSNALSSFNNQNMVFIASEGSKMVKSEREKIQTSCG